LAKLKSVWDAGVGLPWPINTKRDLGRLPKPVRSTTPPDEVVKAWSDTLAAEKDLYYRLVWLLIGSGMRPNHARKLKWRNLTYDPAGRPYSIVADGGREDFKTASPLVMRVGPTLGGTLIEWRSVHAAAVPENPILPAMNEYRDFEWSQIMSADAFSRRWCTMMTKWSLPPLRPKDMRHWVATQCRKVGMSRAASAYLQGHDSGDGTMRDWYDNPPIEDILIEQETKLPDGPLSMLAPSVRIVGELSPEMLKVVVAFKRGDIDQLQLASQMEVLRRQEARVAGLTSG